MNRPSLTHTATVFSSAFAMDNIQEFHKDMHLDAVLTELRNILTVGYIERMMSEIEKEMTAMETAVMAR